MIGGQGSTASRVQRSEWQQRKRGRSPPALARALDLQAGKAGHYLSQLLIRWITSSASLPR